MRQSDLKGELGEKVGELRRIVDVRSAAGIKIEPMSLAIDISKYEGSEREIAEGLLRMQKDGLFGLVEDLPSKEQERGNEVGVRPLVHDPEVVDEHKESRDPSRDFGK